MKSFKYMVMLVLMVVMYSCKKKADFTYDDRLTTLAYANSSTRLINLSNANNLLVNGHRLTNFIIPSQQFGPNPIGTLYFPANGTFGAGSTYTIPQDLLNADGTANVSFIFLPPAANVGPAGQLDTAKNIPGTNVITTNNFTNPNDYFSVFYRNIQIDTVFAIPRSAAAPSVPTHFKIRVVNIIDPGTSSDMQGPLTLTYADGSAVSPVTTNVAQGTSSAYIELPYGTYQFKLQTQNSVELPSATLNGTIKTAPSIDPITGMDVDKNSNSLNQVYSPIQTYEPGGNYSVVASINASFVDFQQEGPLYINSFRILTDVNPPSNLTYARMEAVNTIAGQQVAVQVDGVPLGSALAFGKQTDYQIYVKGDHDVKVIDQAGKVIAEKTISMTGNDVWTAWVYSANGKTDIDFAFDNLSGNTYSGTAGGDNQTGANNVIHTDDITQTRFLNFCTDLPYATFTDQNGQPLQQNLTPGQVVTTSVYSGIPAVTRVYQSQLSPFVVPGNWLTGITPLQATDFIANKALYSRGDFTGLPAAGAEPGIYTVALIGSLNGTAPANAHLIIVKHTK